jgi:hypothetical protein
MSRIILKTDWDSFIADYNLDFMRERKFSSWIIKEKKEKIENLDYEIIEEYWDVFNN